MKESFDCSTTTFLGAKNTRKTMVYRDVQQSEWLANPFYKEKGKSIRIVVSIETIAIGIMVENEHGIRSIGCAETSIIPGKKDCYYFSRLFVQPKYRGMGYGELLLELLLTKFDDEDKVLILDINPYGEMPYEQLEAFYMGKGFQKVDNEETGPMYYYYHGRSDDDAVERQDISY